MEVSKPRLQEIMKEMEPCGVSHDGTPWSSKSNLLPGSISITVLISRKSKQKHLLLFVLSSESINSSKVAPPYNGFYQGICCDGLSSLIPNRALTQARAASSGLCSISSKFNCPSRQLNYRQILDLGNGCLRRLRSLVSSNYRAS